MTLKFKEWEGINEETKVVSSIKNWFSRAVGGAVGHTSERLQESRNKVFL